MADHALVGRKSCGCVTFARLANMRHRIPLAKAAKGLEVERVPAHRAHVQICRCEP